MVTITKKAHEMTGMLINALSIEGGQTEAQEYIFKHGLICYHKDSYLRSNGFDNIANSSLLKVERIDSKKVLADPYIQNFKCTYDISGNIVMGLERKIPGYYLAKYREDKRDPYTFARITSYCYTNIPLLLPVLYEGVNRKEEWMTVEPYEIMTHNSRAVKARGRVLLLGCGLGYSAFRLALEEQVKSIDIVELSPDVKKLYDKNVRDITPNRDKINDIILDDAIKYLYSTKLEKYNHIDVDIWRDTLDMIYPYLKCLALEDQYPDVTFSYWIENTFYTDLQAELLKIMLYLLVGSDGYFEEWTIPGLNTLARYIIRKSEITISSPADLNRLLNPAYLRKMVKEFALTNPDDVEKIGADVGKYITAGMSSVNKSQTHML